MQNNQPVTISPVELKDNTIIPSGSLFNLELDAVYSAIFSNSYNMSLTCIVVIHHTKFVHL